MISAKKFDFIIRDLMILLLSFQIIFLNIGVPPIYKTCNEVVIGIWGILLLFDIFIAGD